ncbi:MAG: HAD family hydrolase [Anaerolineae bacterium]|nr:HAD family hydrolase [Anaerolineae bacterium]
MLKAVVFDMDDTLVNWQAMHGTWADIIQDPLIPVREYLLEQGYTLPDITRMANDYRHHSEALWRASSAPDWIAPRYVNILANVLQQYGNDPSGIDWELVIDLLDWGAISGIYVFGDTFEVLPALREHGVKTGLLTNMPMPIRIRDKEIAAYGLIHLLDVRLTSDDVGHIKPHPAPFLAVLEKLGVEPHEAIYVGDRLLDDVHGAQTAGMRGIWIENEHPTYRPHPEDLVPDATIERLSDLLPILDDWYPGWRNHNA